jgi:putative tryptophan/tyrosine transport system substrate-binding protein
VAFVAVRESPLGPNRRFAAAQQDVRNGGQTGRSADGAGTAVPDPFQKVALNGYDGSFWPLGISMKRRQFITLLGGTAAAWPLVARAQQPAMPVIGFLSSGAASEFASYVAVFRRTLNGVGYIEGQNVAIEYRWAEGQYDRLPALAANLVQGRAAVIFTSGGTTAALAAKAASGTTPIVFIMGADPVAAGLVASLNRPGGNITGVSLITDILRSKRVELLHELVPTASVFAHLSNPTGPQARNEARDIEAAANALGIQVKVLNASSEADFDTAFAALVDQRVGALIVQDDTLFNINLARLAALATRVRVPALYTFRDAAVVGGLMSYGPSRADGWRVASTYVSRILRGEKPSDLPVQQPTKFEMVINLKTAKALGLEIPPTLLGRADEVIE